VRGAARNLANYQPTKPMQSARGIASSAHASSDSAAAAKECAIVGAAKGALYVC